MITRLDVVIIKVVRQIEPSFVPLGEDMWKYATNSTRVLRFFALRMPLYASDTVKVNACA